MQKSLVLLKNDGGALPLAKDAPFTGKLPFSWPRNMDQLSFDFATLPAEGCAAPLFARGYGLDTTVSEPVVLPDCN